MIAPNCVLACLMDLALKIYCAVPEPVNLRPGGFGAPMSPDWIIRASWTVFVIFWFIAALNRKRTAHREPPQRRLIHILFMAFAFCFLFGYLSLAGFAERRLWPDALWVAQLGATLTALGIAFAIWARVHIGRNWSGIVMIKQDHELIRTGPYARIRHPIYTGLLLAVLGTAIAIGEYRAIIGFALILIGFIYKAKREEALLTEHFGTTFEEHKRRTGFFLPRFS